MSQGVYIVLGGYAMFCRPDMIQHGLKSAYHATRVRLVAAGLYSYNESLFRPFINYACPEPDKRTIDRMAGTSYAKFALPMASLLVGVIAALEYVRPWQVDLGGALNAPTEITVRSVLSMKAWPPQIAGIIVGLLQIPATLLLHVTLGILRPATALLAFGSRIL